MLELELKSSGIKAKTISEKFNLPALNLALSQYSHVLLDGDYLENNVDTIGSLEAHVTLFSRKELMVLPENVGEFFHRPFETEALTEHLKGVLGLKKAEAQPTSEHVLELDQFLKQAVVNGKVIKFSPREFALLSLLWKNKGKIVSRSEVIKSVWGEDYDDTNNVDNVYVNYLRNKLDRQLGINLIYTVRGKGYTIK